MSSLSQQFAHDTRHWQDFFYTANDGLKLAGRKYGWDNKDRLPVLCLPGLTRNCADFHSLAMHLANHEKSPRRVLCLDFRGRGKSEYDSNWKNYNPLVEASDVIDGVLAAGLSQVALVGTSRGGMIAMVLAAMRPTLMKMVVLNDIGPEVDGPGLVRIKNYISNSKLPANWDEAAQMLKTIGGKQFPDWDDNEYARQARLIFKEENGRIVHQYDDGLIKSLSSINLDEPLPTFWPQFEGLKKLPLLLLRGANSDLLSSDTVEKMRAVHRDMEVIVVPNQGHAPDLGSAELPQAIGKFISKNE